MQWSCTVLNHWLHCIVSDHYCYYFVKLLFLLLLLPSKTTFIMRQANNKYAYSVTRETNNKQRSCGKTILWLPMDHISSLCVVPKRKYIKQANGLALARRQSSEHRKTKNQNYVLHKMVAAAAPVTAPQWQCIHVAASRMLHISWLTRQLTASRNFSVDKTSMRTLTMKTTITSWRYLVEFISVTILFFQ